MTDITITDGDVIAPNIRQEKVWQLRNTGAISWVEGSRWVQIDEPIPGFPDAAKLSIETQSIRIPAVQPGELYELTLPFTVPANDNVYGARFQMETPQGVRFGVKPWLVFKVNEAERQMRRNRLRWLNRNQPAEAFFSDVQPYPVLMLDISHWQSNPNFAIAKESGIKGIIHKATESVDYVDANYAERRQEVQALGMLWGAYHFVRGTDPKSQIDLFLETAPPDGKTLYALDVEDGTPLDAVVDCLQYLVDQVGTLPLIYTSASQYSRSLSNARRSITSRERDLLAICPLWVADYRFVDEPPLPEPWRDFRWTFWQFTSNGPGSPAHEIPGFVANGRFDANRYHGTADQMTELWHAYTPPVQNITPRAMIAINPVRLGEIN